MLVAVGSLLITHGIEEVVFLGVRIVVLVRSLCGIAHDIKLHLPDPRYTAMHLVSDAFNQYRTDLYLKMKAIG